jgi:hypothetical protein
MAKTLRLVAHISSVPAPNTYGYAWQWKSEDGAATSLRPFPFFYECLSDARARGYDVQLGPRPAALFTSFDTQ